MTTRSSIRGQADANTQPDTVLTVEDVESIVNILVVEKTSPGCVRYVAMRKEKRDQLEAAALKGIEAEGWQPIESAPRNENPIDLWVNGARVTDAWWGRPHHSCGEAGSYCDCCPTRDDWCDVFGYVSGDDGSHSESPTHWRPRPSPPTPQKPEPRAGALGTYMRVMEDREPSPSGSLLEMTDDPTLNEPGEYPPSGSVEGLEYTESDRSEADFQDPECTCKGLPLELHWDTTGCPIHDGLANVEKLAERLLSYRKNHYCPRVCQEAAEAIRKLAQERDEAQLMYQAQVRRTEEADNAMDALSLRVQRLEAFHDVWVEWQVANAIGDPDVSAEIWKKLIAAHKAARAALEDG